MRNLAAFVCLFAVVPILAAQQSPKGRETGLHQRVPVVESSAVASITPDTIAGYQEHSDGTRFTVLHIRNSGAQAIRVRFENIRLPEGAQLLVYGSGTAPAWVYGRGLDDTAVVSGESAFIEIQCGVECPADLPFDIAEVASAPVPDEVPSVVTQGGRGTANFRGVDVDYEVRDGLAILEGDIVLGPVSEMQPPTRSKSPQRDAVALTGSSYRWPNGQVPYAIDYNVSDHSRITAAVNHWNSMLGGAIRFVPRSNESVYLRIVRGGSCSAVIGMGWVNTMYLSDSCNTGIVIHELGHTLGLYHEHTREDRDQNVRIHTENILTSALSDFAQKINSSNDIGAYDFNSIMHYGPFSGSANGRPTIETIPAGIPIGQRNGLSTGDIAAVRKMYGFGYTLPTVPEPVPQPVPQPTPDPVPVPQPPPVVTPVAVTISANPASEQIIVDGTSYVGSATLQWIPGSSHTIRAADRASQGSTATFVRWSDYGAATHTITASSAVTLYKADYSISYAVDVTSSDRAMGNVSVSPVSSTGYYPANSAVRLAADPAFGYCFTGWSGLISGTPSDTTLLVTKPYEVTGRFARAEFALAEQVAFVDESQRTHSTEVTATQGCSWTASSQTTWIQTPSITRTGSGSQSYTVEANNTGRMRIGVLVIAGRPLYVVQNP